MIHAVVTLSGGMDSAVVLHHAIKEHGRTNVAAIVFHYGQLHKEEIAAAQDIAKAAGIPLRSARASALETSALTSAAIPVAAGGGFNGLPSTFTASRNLIFIGIASSFCAEVGASRLYLGINQPVEGVGYPDCSERFVLVAQEAVRVGNAWNEFTIEAPLLRMTKQEIVELAQALGPDCWAAVTRSVTCYRGERPGCGACLACLNRRAGFLLADIPDPSVGA